MNTIDFQNLRDDLFEKLGDIKNDLLRSLKKLENKSNEGDQDLRKKIE